MVFFMSMSISLSPSKLNLFVDCPRCFWLHVKKNIKRPEGPMAGVLTKMDSIVKHYFEKYRDKGELPPIIKGKVKGRLAKGMPKTLYYTFGDFVVRGLPDDYLELDDNVIVPLDHKTSRGKSAEETHKAHVLQMDVYSFLLKVNNYKTTNKAYLAYYYPDDCDIHDGLDICCTVTEIKTNPDNAKKIIDDAIKVLNGKMPNPSSECGFCKWRAVKV